MSNKSKIKARKKEHLELAAFEESQYQDLTSGFENYRFVHCALPEMDFSEVSLQTKLMGYDLSCPLIINPVSGGEINGKKFNRDLAQISVREKIAFSLGSIRAVLEDINNLESYSIVSSYTQEIPLIVNIGCLEIKKSEYRDKLLEICDKLEADAISVHLNPLQELLQPEGGYNFQGILQAIETLNRQSQKPLIVKEVGFGLSKEVVKKLKRVGISWVDIAGSGGTSWSRIETQRIKNEFDKQIAREFLEWGIPTAGCLTNIKSINDINIIASGGINSGQEWAKALALGADYVGLAGVLVRTWSATGSEGVEKLIKRFKEVLKRVLFLTGCRNLNEYRKNSDIIESIK